MSILDRLESQEWYNGQNVADVLALVEFEIERDEAKVSEAEASGIDNQIQYAHVAQARERLARNYKARAALIDELDEIERKRDEIPF